MNRKEEIKKEIQSVSPYLTDRLQSAPNPKVPDGYFQKFEDSFIRDVVRPDALAQGASERKSGFLARVDEFLSSLLSPRYSLVLTSLAVVLLASVWIFSPQNDPNSSLDFASLSEAEVDHFIEDNLDDFLLADLSLEGNQTDEEGLFDNLDPAILESYSDEVIEEMELIDLENIF